MGRWSGVSQAYRDSFATLCRGTERRILDDLPLGPLLDVRSGTGSLAMAADRRGFSVTAVDADPDMVTMTNEALPGSCTRQSLPRLAVGDGAFGAVVVSFVVNHLGDPRAGVRELARVTAPRGRRSPALRLHRRLRRRGPLTPRPRVVGSPASSGALARGRAG